MPRTPEQREADAALRAAIEALMKVDNPETDTGLLVDFVVVAQCTGFDSEGDEGSAYYLMFPEGQMPEHRASGLLTYGNHLLLHGRGVNE